VQTLFKNNSDSKKGQPFMIIYLSAIKIKIAQDYNYPSQTHEFAMAW